MTTQVSFFQDITPAADIAKQAISAVVNGEIDPLKAYVTISRIEAAVKMYKDNSEIRDITLRELSKYGKSHTFGDCKLEEAEVGVRYDFSACQDSKLHDMYATLEALKADIKERENMLKVLPSSGLADPETGEMLYPPAKASKTTIRTTFKKQ